MQVRAGGATGIPGQTNLLTLLDLLADLHQQLAHVHVDGGVFTAMADHDVTSHVSMAGGLDDDAIAG